MHFPSRRLNDTRTKAPNALSERFLRKDVEVNLNEIDVSNEWFGREFVAVIGQV